MKRPFADVGSLGAVLEGLALGSGAISPLLAFARMVERDSDRLGLVGPSDEGRVLSRHVADSLYFAYVMRPGPGQRWADVGSGAGFPGVPLAIAFPEATFTLIEPQGRKAGFLELAASDLGLDNVVVINDRAEAAARTFDAAVTRAFSSNAASGASVAAFALLERLIVPGGAAIVAVGADTPIPEGVREVQAVPPNLDSSGRYLMMTC